MKECSCNICKSACEHKPGWFKPEEIKKLAKAMKLTPKQLFDKHLAVDWWENGFSDFTEDSEGNVFLIAPALQDEDPGIEYPSDPRGVCVFYENGKCKIHTKGKPYECAKYHHDCENPGNIHMSVAKAWMDHQDFVKELLGREPEAAEFNGGFFDLF